MVLKNSNKYDIYIYLLILSLAFGGFGGLFRFHRVLSVLLLPELISKSSKCMGFVRPFYLFFVFFTIYSFLSLLWAPNMSDAYTYYFAYCLFDFLIFIQIIVFSYFSKNPIHTISYSWLLAVSLTLMIAFWEITTDNHLSFAKQDSETFNNAIFIRRFACVTFYNFNTYVTYLCFALPFIFYLLICPAKRMVLKFFFATIIILSFVAILFNASRGGVMAVLIMSLLYLILTQKARTSILVVSFFVIALVVVLGMLDESVYFFVSGKFETRGIIEDEGRFSIWADALGIVSSSYGLGTGIGGIESAMMKASHSGFLAPHNMFIELMLNSGVIIFLLFIVFVIKIFIKSFSLKDSSLKATLIIALLPMPIYSVINSTYLNNAFVFCVIACLTVFANYETKGLYKRRTMSQLFHV